MKKHEIFVRVDGEEKWVDANVWYDYMTNKIKSSLEKRRVKFIANVVSYGKEKGIETDLITRFCDYWTESNENGKKMRFEMQKTFSIGGRLSTFVKNKIEWSKNFTKNRNELALSDSEIEKRYAKQQEYYNANAEQEYSSQEEIREILLKGKK